MNSTTIPCNSIPFHIRVKKFNEFNPNGIQRTFKEHNKNYYYFTETSFSYKSYVTKIQK